MRAPRKMLPPQAANRYLLAWHPPDYEWLYDQYITQEKAARQIAKEVRVGCSKTVGKWLDDLRIPKHTKVQMFQRQSAQKTTSETERCSRQRARNRLIREGRPIKCTSCGKTQGKICAHHKDGDPYNNRLENLQWLCNSCHLKLHYVKDPWPIG